MAKRWCLFLLIFLCSALLAVQATKAQPLQPPADLAGLGSMPSGPAGLVLLAPAIRVLPESSAVQAGTVFTVTVQAGDVVDLGSFDFTLTFNPAALSVQTATLGSFLGSTGRTVGALGPITNNVTGSVRFGAFSFGASVGPDGSGTLATFTFRALSPGSSPLHFAGMQYTDTKIPVGTQVPNPTDGLVTVLGPTPTPTTPLPVRRVYLPMMVKQRP